jgi:Tol biopolymer transport system component
MTLRNTLFLSTIAATLIAVRFWAPRPAGAQTLHLISAPDSILGPALGAGGDSGAAILTPDGRYVVFGSSAENLLVMGTNGPVPPRLSRPVNVYLRDRSTATTALVSVDVAGRAGGNAGSLPRAISTNGRLVLFEGLADNLVPNDTNNASDVFLRDLTTGTTILVSANTNGSAGNGGSKNAVMSPDGRYVAFASLANNLVSGDTNRLQDIFVWDVQTGTTVLASFGSMSNSIGYPTGRSDTPVMTPDGRFVAFSSVSGRRTVGLLSPEEIYRRDLMEGTTIWVSADASNAVYSVFGFNTATAFNHALSDDGQFVVYEAARDDGSPAILLRYDAATGIAVPLHTNAANATIAGGALDLTPDGQKVVFVANSGDNSGRSTAILLWDSASSTTALVSETLINPGPEFSDANAPAIESTGRYVAFLSSDPGMVTNEVTAGTHVYVRDLQTGTTILADQDGLGRGSGASRSDFPCLSADGRFVAFTAPDGTLVPSDQNGYYDVFTRDLASGTNDLVSACATALQSFAADGPSTLSAGCVSADGKFIAFRSQARNLVTGNFDGHFQVFVRDLTAQTNVLISINTNGVPADANSTEPVLTADGTRVIFTSYASDLAPGVNTNVQNVFIRDWRDGTTTLVSVSTNGLRGGNANSYSPIASSDGRFVLFNSQAANLAWGLSGSGPWAFLRDVQANQTFALFPTVVTNFAMTGDGHFVAFGAKALSTSNAIVVWDALTGARIQTNSVYGIAGPMAISADGTRIVYYLNSSALPGTQIKVFDRANQTNWTIAPYPIASKPGLRFSADGRLITYAAQVTARQVFLYDFSSGTTQLVSRAFASGEPGNAASDSPDISADGRFIAYHSAASDLVPSDTNNVPDIFIYDRITGTTTLLTSSRLGPWSAANRSMDPFFSGDGKTIFFASAGSDLLEHDFNNTLDIFAYAIVSSSDIPVFQVSLLPAMEGIALTWPVPPGTMCRVQFKNALTDLEWQDLTTGVTIIGNQGYLRESSAGPQRFYRIIARPLLAGG